MTFFLLFLIFFGLLFYPKVFINIFLGISIIIPSTHSSAAYKIQLMSFNFSYSDLFILALFLSFFLKSLFKNSFKIALKPHKKIVLAFIIINIIYLIFGILIYDDLSQSLYDFRVVFYYSLLLINFNTFLSKKNFNSIIYTFLISLGIYSILCLTVFISFKNHPYAIFFLEDNFLSFGRIGFQQDFLFIIAIPFVIFLINNLNGKRRIFLYLLLSIYSLKVLLGMSRGLMFFLFLNLVICFWNYKLNIRYIKSSFFKSLFKIVATFGVLIFTIFNYFIPLIFKDESSVVTGYLASRFTSAFESDNSSFIANHVDNRLLMWEQGIYEIFYSGFMGKGYGYTFTIDHPEWYLTTLSFIDSSFVTIIIRSGIFSFVLLLMIYLNQRLILKKIIFLSDQVTTSLFFKTLYISIPILLLYGIFNGFMVFSISMFSLILIFSIINSIFEIKSGT